MNKSLVKILVLSGDGINCENETALAFQELGASPSIVHVNELIARPQMMNDFHIFALPGGFSFGDEISSGQILALKLKTYLSSAIDEFISKKKCIIGICNGFQVLVKLGILSCERNTRDISLVHNSQNHFTNQWVSMNVCESRSIWTRSLQGKNILLPIRHGEGRVVFKGNHEAQQKSFNHMLSKGQIVMTYNESVNGSYQNIAALCDPTGLVLGLMPHPEAAVFDWLNPDGNLKSSSYGVGMEFFKNALNYFCEEF